MSLSLSLFPTLETLFFTGAPEQISADLQQNLEPAIEKSMYSWLFVEIYILTHHQDVVQINDYSDLNPPKNL